MADTSWVSDSSYLGEPLAGALSLLKEVPAVFRGKAPVFIRDTTSGFENEKSYENMDYTDEGYRLLGLFRLWNAIEYYYPYRDVLDDNIGLINHGKLTVGEVDKIMKEFAGTTGLIIDLRQYPLGSMLMPSLAKYIVDANLPFAVISSPSNTVPGTFIDYSTQYSGSAADGAYYTKQVVLLVDEITQSYGEHMILGLGNGAHVTVMGQNSVGADGGLIQRVGISPDIYLQRTIAGIRDGRDEFLEAAVQYILNSK